MFQHEDSQPKRENSPFVVAVQSLSHVQLFAIPWTAESQVPLSSTVSWSLLKFTSIESVMLSKHLILCHPILLLPSVFPSIKVFSSESALHIRWPKYWSFSFSISPSNEYLGLISCKFRHQMSSLFGYVLCYGGKEFTQVYSYSNI